MNLISDDSVDPTEESADDRDPVEQNRLEKFIKCMKKSPKYIIRRCISFYF